MNQYSPYCYEHDYPDQLICPKCKYWREHWSRWINPFGHSELHEWQVRLSQCLFMFALPWVVLFVLGFI
jgi:hypothetical protein